MPCRLLRFSVRLARWIIAAAVLAGAAPVFADGPGLGNLTYNTNELFATLQRFTSTNAAPRGHGLVAMHKGYLVVIFSDDGGGGNGTGGFTFYNVSNPRSATVSFTTQNNPPYTTSTHSNYAGNIREAHGFSFWGDLVCIPSNTRNVQGTNTGLQFWDWSNIDPPNPTPVKISQLDLPGLTGGDYAPTPWWVFWQGGRYVYVGGTSAGIYIVDAGNPYAPVLANRGPGLPNPIPTGQIGNFRANTMFAIGNLMVISASDASGVSTLDISDPLNPVLLDSIYPGTQLYSIMVNGDRILGAHDPAKVWDISDPGNITHIADGPNVAEKGGYGTFQDGVFHYGSSSCYVKLNVSSVPFTILGTNSPTGFGTNPDWDFATVLGNLVFQGNDHDGSALVVHQVAPDTNGPLVNMVVPRNGATNQALTSRVGLTFTDQIDLRSVNTNTVIIRPLNGQALPGRYSLQTGIVNFWPDQPLQPNTTYEVVVPAGGIRDYVSNAASLTFTSRFSTVFTAVPASVTAGAAAPATPGQTVNFIANGSGSGVLQYSWSFGDGSPPTAFTTNHQASHAFAQAGHYSVTVTVTNGTSQAAASFVQTVYNPLTPSSPANSSTIVIDAAANRVWNVNPDADTVTAVHATNFAKLLEKPVGKHPRTLAQAPDGTIWVVNQDDATISVLSSVTGDPVQSPIALPRGSRPYGIAFAPDGSAAYVTLQGTGRLLRLDPPTRTVTADIGVVLTPRGIAISADSQRVFVTRFRSPDTGGEVVEVNAATLAITRTFTLALDPGPDLEDSGRGVPNFLSSITIAPDGLRAWIPSKKDNIQRGEYRDGLALDFESTVRTIVSQLDLAANAEDLGARRDLNDRDMAFAAQFSPLGDYVFVAIQGGNAVDVLDAYSGERVTALENAGLAPQGLAVSADGRRLFVQNFMSRTIRVFDISGIVASTNNVAPVLATVAAVTNEPLSAPVLLGKQIFYNADDSRMNLDSYISCASCHLDGEHDGRVWDFTDRGEGLRNTVSLIGRGGTGHGRVHWTANFDEIQDFEHDIRGPFGGDGFMSDAAFTNGTRNTTLGDRKGGFSPELDALAAYVSSLTNVNPSPFRNPDGSLTADAVAGKALFASANCASCHTGNQFTDSSADLLHDVGTIKPSSGQRLNQPLTGIDTPTLKGVWETAPYFHDGSAAALADVFADTNAHHGALTASLSAPQKEQLIAYLLQIDDTEVVNVPPVATIVSPAEGAIFLPPTDITITAAASDSNGIRRVEFFANGIWLGEITNSPFILVWSNAPAGSHQLAVRATDLPGDMTLSAPVNITVDPLGFALRWNSTASVFWDTNAANWFDPFTSAAAAFAQGDDVRFDDQPGVVTNVSILGGFVAQPASVTVDSSTNAFTLNGPGRIGGAASLTKRGTSRLTLGTSNDFTGAVTVSGGTLRINHNNALGASNGVTVVNSGASFDVGGPTFAANTVNVLNETIVVSGAGFDGVGVIINSSVAPQQNALHHVQLAGDATFGGVSRWDIRNNGGPASLSTGGQPWNLTKVGANQINLVGAAIDTNLAGITIASGQLGFEGSLSSLGNPDETLTVLTGATARFTGWTSILKKVLVVELGGTIFNTSGSNVFGGPVILQSNATFNVGGTALVLTNVVSGAGSLIKTTGSSPLYLAASNTYSGATLVNVGTVWLTGQGAIRHSTSIDIATGAVLNVSGRVDGTLTVTSGQTLRGNGTVAGAVTVNPGGRISPGVSIGALTVSDALTLQGAAVIEVNKSTLTNDVIRGVTAITYGGTLNVTNLSGSLAAGDSFKLFYAASYAGAFDQIVPAWAGPGLAWDTSGLTNGTLRVAAATSPRITGIAQSGMNLVVSGSNGVRHADYFVLASTNLTLPLSNWSVVATNLFDANGLFIFTNTIDANGGRKFFRLRQP